MAYERTLERVDNFVFSLDGTVWEWNRLKKSVKSTIQDLEGKGKDIYYLTNNSILSPEKAAQKLSKLGLDTDPDRVLTAAHIAAYALDEENVRKAFVIGEDGLLSELRAHSISKVDDADHVLVGVDRNFSYWKMADAAELLRNGATLWATDTAAYWSGGDRYLPGTGAQLSSILKTADTDSDAVRVLGKPSKYARDVVKAEWDLMPNRTALIGDDLGTDIRFGNQLGYKTGLVLGGRSTEEDLHEVNDFDKPHIVFREFDRILQKV